ncbi:hypothetical protein F8388_009319 [Cannabis sativa]|uniref:Uncharacterized protein n=1 Tax=Cannabis sativa TaxID=3483 RepID=A0A7J6GKF4_CANSA|nr:hypothetical protein F8388_009319 [Cannabis sativa]
MSRLLSVQEKTNRVGDIMFGTAVRYFATKPKPKMKPIELKTPPEQTQTITRVIFDIIVLRWMRERQKLRQICNHVGPHKQFLYTTWFTKHNTTTTTNHNKTVNDPPKPKSL